MDAIISLLKAARTALGVPPDQFAKEAGVSRRSLSRLEAADSETTLKTIRAVRQALEEKGVVFLPQDGELGPGFRLPKDFVVPDYGTVRKSPVKD